MYFNKDILERARDPRSLFVFFHCQRTGGSNVQRWLQQAIDPKQIFSNRTGDSFVQWQKLTDFSILDGYKLVAGFADYRDYPLGRPIIALANARHPFYRIVSLYRMSRGHTNHFMHQIAISSSFEDWYRAGRESKPFYFHNLQCRRIGGDTSFDAAAEAMHRDFGMVAPTNFLHEATTELVKALGWPIQPMQATGVPPDDVNYAKFDASPVRDEIMAKNQEDMKLFDYVMNAAQRPLIKAAPPLAPEQIKVLKAQPSPAASKKPAPAAKPPTPSEPSHLDSSYADFVKSNPGVSYSEFYTTRVASKVRTGTHVHNSLGSNIVTGDITEFWETGARQAARLIRIGGVQPSDRVVEYGCGSLRVAAHFIKLLDKGNFFGLDIIPDFYELGRPSVGLDLIAAKEPKLAAISPQSVAEAAAFRPNYVFSHAVHIHVHPDDQQSYFQNLAKIAGAPGTTLAFNVMLYPEPVRYNNLGWAWPEDTIKRRLPDFDCVKVDIVAQDDRTRRLPASRRDVDLQKACSIDSVGRRRNSRRALPVRRPRQQQCSSTRMSLQQRVRRTRCSAFSLRSAPAAQPWCAGSARRFRSDKVYVHHNVPNFVHWKKTPSEDLKNSLAYAGFSEFVPRDLGGRPFAAFSLVRHPVYRIASLYEVSKRDKSLVYHRVAAASSFEDFYRHVAADRPYYFSNLCCYRIANQDSFAAAQEAMSKHYAAVGLADQIAAMTRGIADNIGWSIEPLTDQTSDVVKYAKYLESPALDEILSNNKEDLRLFEYVQSAGSDQGAVAVLCRHRSCKRGCADNRAQHCETMPRLRKRH